MKKLLLLVATCPGFAATSLFPGEGAPIESPPFPARSALGASGLAFGARVEVECIAAAVDKSTGRQRN